MKCFYKGCAKQAKWDVRLSLAVHDNHPPAISTPVMSLCDEHKDVPTFEELTPPENWKLICDSFLSIGKMPPEKKYSKLKITPIKNDPKLN